MGLSSQRLTAQDVSRHDSARQYETRSEFLKHNCVRQSWSGLGMSRFGKTRIKISQRHAGPDRVRRDVSRPGKTRQGQFSTKRG